MANEKRLMYVNDFLDLFYVASAGQDKAFIKAVEMVVEDTPTVDAVEVVHGQWIPLEYDGFADGNPVWDLWECSECREEHSGDEDTLTPYCPNCGAKMDGERREGE